MPFSFFVGPAMYRACMKSSKDFLKLDSQLRRVSEASDEEEERERRQSLAAGEVTSEECDEEDEGYSEIRLKRNDNQLRKLKEGDLFIEFLCFQAPGPCPLPRPSPCPRKGRTPGPQSCLLLRRGRKLDPGN